ncbi:hypothetical protein E1162_12155 [Rhodobacteraceae bacterium RKSG542]|uniref:hypothetical protein n=1 Tax=Pseudovibrio flavus TaxID=2529854 RepID=UPI0012BBBA7A|nr:hypothetical protein [Pseudovibrio flavus]MTI17990.1 hypothetical protein [Pseudovibrio flavus]
MLSQVINEITWHYLGYLKLYDDQFGDLVEYKSGAEVLAGLPNADVAFEAQVEINDDDLPSFNQQSVTVASVSSNVAAAAPLLFGNSYDPAFSDVVPSASEALHGFTDGEVNIPEFPFPPEYTYTITAYYRSIDAPSGHIFTSQRNEVTDNDELTMEHVHWQGGPELEQRDALSEEFNMVSSHLEIEFLNGLGNGGADEALTDFAQGQVTRAESGLNDGLNISIGQNLIAERDAAPTGDLEPGKVVSLGDNETVNVAAIVNASEASSSFIVVGNYYSTDAIIQSNFYLNESAENFADQPLSNESNDTVKNVGEVSSSGDYLISSQYVPGRGDYTLLVDTVQGDFYDVSILKQTNLLIDDDIIRYETNESDYFIAIGNNTQVNAGQIIHAFSEYDLIVVSGNYFDVNSIYQKNVVLDYDFVVASNSIVTGGDGNEISNQAKISNIGGGPLFKEMDSGIQSFTTNILNSETSFEYTTKKIGNGMPNLSDNSLNVLMIQGDYYQVNSIFQENYLSDMDAGRVVSAAGGHEDASSGELELIQTSKNVAKNEAIIVDYDSQSEFQYLGGEYSEEDILIQANIVVTNFDDLNSAQGSIDDLVSEVIAFAGASAEEDLHISSGGGKGPAETNDAISDVFA